MQRYTTRGYGDGHCAILANQSNCIGEVYLEPLTHDARGRVATERRLGGPVTSRSFRSSDGQLEREWVSHGGQNLLDWNYVYGPSGRMVSREDRRDGITPRPLTETYARDALDRLTRVDLSGSGLSATTVSLSYDSLGNVCSKQTAAGFRSYTYAGRSGCAGALNDANRSPHAVIGVSGSINTNYSYNANGDQTSASGSRNRRVSYDPSRQPLAIESLSGPGGSVLSQVRFALGVSGARLQRRDCAADCSAAGTRTTTYIGSVEIRRVNDGSGNTVYRRQFGGVVIEKTVTARGAASTSPTKLIYTDHQG